MNYSQEKQTELLDRELQKLSKQLTICRLVKETADSKGWSETLAPILDKMIIDIVGGKLNGQWMTGKLDRARKDERREFYIGAKQALIEFHQRVQFHIDQIKVLEEAIKENLKQKEQDYKMPMEESRYAV